MLPDAPTPVLEVGGTHVTAALVETGKDESGTPGADSWRLLPGTIVRRDLHAHAPAGRLLDELAREPGRPPHGRAGSTPATGAPPSPGPSTTGTA